MPPSFSSVIQATDKEETQIGTTVDVQAFGGSGVNPKAVDIHGQPMPYGGFVHDQQNSLNQFQDGSISRGLDHVNWYSGGGQPPSVGAMRPGVISQPSGSNQLYSDGQPPSLNDVGRRETSQTGVSAGHEVADAHEMAGMSLTRNNFRMLYAASYSKGIDGK